MIKRLLALLLVSTAAVAAAPGELHVMQPWSRATPPGTTVAVGYVMLHNLGPKPQVIVSASSPLADSIEIHETRRTPEGLTQMRPLAEVTLPPGGAYSFEPNGPHLMLVGLKAPLVAGQKAPVTLNLKSGETLSFELEVRALTDVGPEAHAHH